MEEQQKPDNIDENISDDESNDEPATELGLHMLNICDIMTDLFKLSFKIRSSATRQRTLKPALYKEVDKETNIDIFEVYALIDHTHVLQSFKQLRRETAAKNSMEDLDALENEPEGLYLIERLASAITKRRRALRYWQRHAKKLAEDPSIHTRHDTNVATIAKNSAIAERGIEQISGQANPARLGLQPTTTKSLQLTILSGTEATTYDRQFDDALDTHSIISYARTAYDSNQDPVDLPPAPATALEGNEFLCPYCSVVCPAKYGKGKAWRYFLPLRKLVSTIQAY